MGARMLQSPPFFTVYKYGQCCGWGSSAATSEERKGQKRLPEEFLFKQIIEEWVGIRGRVLGREGTACLGGRAWIQVIDWVS